MDFKIDTKEKMHVITVEETKLAANLTDDFQKALLAYLPQPINNLVINLEKVIEIDDRIANLLVNIQQTFYDANHSLVYCCLQPGVLAFLGKSEFLEILNCTPTVSEAGDIVQMDEIEREFL